MKYRFRTQPWPHQVKALKKLLRNGDAGGGLFMPMRTGKSKVAIDYACIQYQRGKVKKVLVVTVKSAMGTWRQQIRQHKPEDVDIKWVVLNYERVWDRERYEDGSWMPIPRKALYKWKPDLIIVDESHKVGDPSTVQSSELYRLKRELGCAILLLTGTAFHRNPLRIFGQFKLYDEGIFGTAYQAFERQYALKGGWGNTKLIKYLNTDVLTKKVGAHAFVMDHVPFREPVHVPVLFKLEESLAYYEQMADEAAARVGKHDIEAPIVLVQRLRLSQMCGGHAGIGEGKVVKIGEEKKRAFEGLLQQFVENDIQKLVVFAQFVQELPDIGYACREAGYRIFLLHGGVEEAERERRILAFNEQEEPSVFISQTATGSLGIDLSCADTAVFYSHPKSLVDYDQDMARIRTFKDKRALTYYHMMAEGGMDEVEYTALERGLEVVKFLMDHPELFVYREKG